MQEKRKREKRRKLIAVRKRASKNFEIKLMQVIGRRGREGSS